MILTAVLLLLLWGAAGFLVYLSFSAPSLKLGLVTALGAFVFFLVGVASTGLHIVPAGYVGVITNFGRVEERTLPAGLQYVTPIVEGIVNVDTRVQPHDFKDIDAASKEYQQVRASGKLNYHLDPAYAYIVYRQVGLDFADKVIDPALNDFIKEAMPAYAITDILPQRDKIRAQAKEAMNANLARYHIIIDDIYLANLSFSPEYEKAIEAKQVAAQGVQTQQQLLAQKKIQAEQAVVEAQGQADANDVLTKSLTPELIQYIAVQKLNPNVQMIMVPSSNGLIFNVGDLQKVTNP